MMRYLTKKFVLVGSLLATASVWSAATTEINWDDLLSPAVVKIREESQVLQKRILELNDDDRTTYQQIAEELSLQEQIAAGDINKGDLDSSRLEVLDRNLSAKHPEIVAFWEEVKAINDRAESVYDKTDPELDGKSIRMPGYVLPLETVDGKVLEFMLVPYVGACIHTPPPPANQLVHVKFSDGFSNEDLYTPVWVEGVMSTDTGTYDLAYSDGNRDIEAGYSLDAVAIEPYTPPQ